MFQLMRNTHLVLGIAFFMVALLFAVSSLKFVYRDSFPSERVETEDTISVSASDAATPRALAMHIMESQGLAGDLRRTQQADGETRLTIARPGTEINVTYTPASGKAVIKHRRYDFFEALVQLHVNHGLGHDYWPTQAWSLFTFLTSIGFFLLGGTGVYLWFVNYQERLIGGAIFGVGLCWGLVTLYLCRV